MIAHLLRVTKSELEEYVSESISLENRMYDEETEFENLVDIDKTWDGIIFLLTGEGLSTSRHPLVKVLFSGQHIGKEQDLGCGPAHYLTPEQVVELNNEISLFTISDLKQRFNPEKMKQLNIYPPIWDRGDHTFDYIANGFTTVQNIFAEAKKNDEAIITFLT